jgi:hypothetical protein
MTIKLEFRSTRGDLLHKKDFVFDGLVPLPENEERISLPSGLRATVKGRQFVYADAQTGDVKIIFECETLQPRPTKRPPR